MDIYIYETTPEAVVQALVHDPERSKTPGDGGQNFIQYMSFHQDGISYTNGEHSWRIALVRCSMARQSAGPLHYIHELSNALERGGMRAPVIVVDKTILIPEGYRPGSQGIAAPAPPPPHLAAQRRA